MIIRMKKIIISIVFIFLFSLLSAQNIKLLAPKLVGKEARLYFFEGAKVDSLVSEVDVHGELTFSIPQNSYRGMAVLAISDAGALEMVVAEPLVKVLCDTTQLNNQSVSFPDTEENNFFKYIFTTQTQYLQKENWLESGLKLFPSNQLLKIQLEAEQKQVVSSKLKLEKDIYTSQLYAAQYYRLADFMNRLFNTEQQIDKESAILIRKEMEESINIASLYNSGQLWNSVLNFYISMFNRIMDSDVKQKEYAKSILKIIERLPAPYFEAFLSGCITETERFGWRDAQEIIIADLLKRYPGYISDKENLRRAIGAYRVNNKEKMPEIVGLKPDKQVYSKTLIAFHDSDCNSCVNEMFRLEVIYPQLKEKGIRVVSIAADTNQKHYEEATKNFPWPDKLCDFQGFMGSNFSNFNIIASPSFYIIDEDGKLSGIYFNISDIEKYIQK